MDDKYKTFWSRLWAGILDGLVLGFTLMGISFFIPNLGLFQGLQAELMVVAPTLYFTICHWRFGQTWGKKLNHIVVLDVSEKKLLNFHQALSREIVGWLEILNFIFPYINRVFPLITIILGWLAALWFPIEVITMLSNKKRRALHDLLANSVVVREKYVNWNNINR